MFRSAVTNVLKKNQLLILSVVVASTIGMYWRNGHISLFALCLILLVALGGILLVAVPAELHRLRNGR